MSTILTGVIAHLIRAIKGKASIVPVHTDSAICGDASVSSLTLNQGPGAVIGDYIIITTKSREAVNIPSGFTQIAYTANPNNTDRLTFFGKLVDTAGEKDWVVSPVTTSSRFDASIVVLRTGGKVPTFDFSAVSSGSVTTLPYTKTNVSGIAIAGVSAYGNTMGGSNASFYFRRGANTIQGKYSFTDICGPIRPYIRFAAGWLPTDETVTLTPSFFTLVSSNELTGHWGGVLQISDISAPQTGIYHRDFSVKDTSDLTTFSTCITDTSFPSSNEAADYGLTLSLSGHAGDGRIRLGSLPAMKDFDMTVRLSSPSLGSFQTGMVYRTTNWNNGNDTYAYGVSITNGALEVTRCSNQSNPSWTSLGNVSLYASPWVYYSPNSPIILRVVIQGTRHRFYINGHLMLDITDTVHQNAGQFGLRMYNSRASVATAKWQSVRITNLD